MNKFGSLEVVLFIRWIFRSLYFIFSNNNCLVLFLISFCHHFFFVFFRGIDGIAKFSSTLFDKSEEAIWMRYIFSTYSKECYTGRVSTKNCQWILSFYITWFSPHLSFLTETPKFLKESKKKEGFSFNTKFMKRCKKNIYKLYYFYSL